MFGRKLINGSVKWLRVPRFLRRYGPPWALNLLAPYADGGGRGSSTSQSLSIGYEGYYGSVFIKWNWPARVAPIYHQRIFDNTRSSARCARDDLIMENHTYPMQSSSTCSNPIRGPLVNQRDDTLDDCWDFSVHQ